MLYLSLHAHPNLRTPGTPQQREAPNNGSPNLIILIGCSQHEPNPNGCEPIDSPPASYGNNS